MNVLEIKNNLVKISYNADDNLKLAGFLVIEDEKTAYVAQILSLKADKTTNFAIVKLMFTFNEEGILQSYDGSVPALNAEITNLKSSELLEVLPINAPLEIGNLAQEDDLLTVDYSMLEKNLLVCSEKHENTNILLKNFLLQLENNSDKSIIFDNDGDFEGEKLVFGKDFKLPLNYDTINYIYEHDLEGVDATSKAIIQDIFLEIQEYSKTVLDKFIPFDTFVEVVDSQYKSTNLEELVLLKNKLIKYKELNVFAQDAKDFQVLRGAVRSNLTTVLDISTVEDSLQNVIISTVYNIIDELDLFVYSFVKFTNENSNKKLIRQIISKNKIYTTLICSHNYKYIYELKERANNIIFFAPLTLQHDFASYNTFLNKLNTDEFVICGKATQNIPLIIELAEIEKIKDIQEESADTVEDVETTVSDSSEDVEDVEPEEVEEKQDDFSSESDSYSYESLLEDTAITESNDDTKDISDEITENNEDDIVEPENILSEPEEDSAVDPENILLETEEDETTSSINEKFIENETDEVTTPQNIGLMIDEDIAEEQNDELPDIISEEIPVEDSFINEENFEQLSLESSQDNIEQDIVEQDTAEQGDNEQNTIEQDDSVQDDSDDINTEVSETEILESDENELEQIPEIEDINEPEDTENSTSEVFIEENTEVLEDTNYLETSDNKEISENLTEDDLNFIEDINADNDFEPALPVYDVKDTLNNHNNSVVEFQQGDRVSHQKYGEGIVEKIVRYGEKNLYSINFVNVGIRLLDPTISELTIV